MPSRRHIAPLHRTFFDVHSTSLLIFVSVENVFDMNWNASYHPLLLGVTVVDFGTQSRFWLSGSYVALNHHQALI